MSSSVRKRKGSADMTLLPILPQTTADVSRLQQSYGRKHRRRRPTNWTQTLRNCLVCLLIITMACGAVVFFVPADHLAKHKSKLHHHGRKMVDFANKHKHKVIQPLKTIVKTARRQSLLKLKSSLKRTTIICSNGAKGYLNDDYCDCSDGRDEPLTSACSHVLVQIGSFTCVDGSGTIFASRVGDGVKDCADGSDERPTNKHETIHSRMHKVPGIHEILALSSL
jgi:hypothetical protein